MTASITPTASSPHHPASNPFITNINQNPPLGAATNGTGTHNVKFVQYSERVKFQPPAPQNINVGTNITHPTHTRPSTNESNETTNQQQQQQTQVKQERALSNKSTFRLQWTHKKGKPKPQQFWIYCEEAQQNYVRVELLSNGFTWSASSRVMRINNRPSCVAFIENIFGKEERLEALIFDISSTPINPVVESVLASDLSEVQASEFSVLFQIKEDDSFPKHPHQGRPEEVRIQQSVLNDAQIPTPFCYIGKFTFKNRAEGWFRLGAALHYKGTPLFEGYSDLFMFNNPRMIRKKQMSCYQPTEIKFMQVYSLSNDRTEEQWLELGKQLDFTPQHTLELLQNAQLIFKKALSSSSRTNNSRRKRLRDSETPVDDEFSPSLKRSTSAPSSTSTSTVGYPSAPTTLPSHFPTRSHSNLSAMQHPSRSLSQSPPHSTIQPNAIPSRGAPLMHSQLPLMSQTYHPLPSTSSPSSSQFSHLTGYSSLQMNSAQIPSRTQALVLPHIHQTGDNEYKSFSRPLPSIINIPQAASIINTNTNTASSTTSNTISQQLSVSPNQPMDIVCNNDENVISVYYQFLTPQLKLESTSLHSIRCLKTTSIDQFIKSVQQCNPSQPHIRHLYIHSGAKGTCELMDTLDLISFFKSQSFPKILISSHDDVHQPNPDVFQQLPKFVFSVREHHDDQQQVYKIFTNALKISELQGAIAKNFKKSISQIASLEHNGERITAQTLKDYKDILFEAIITVHWS